MRLIDYIRGNRRGKEANRLEKEAMGDPFLSEAIEGFDAVYGNHPQKVADLRSKVEKMSLKKHKPIRSGGGAGSGRGGRLAIAWGLAAAIMIGAGIGIYHLTESPRPDGPLLAMEEYLPPITRETLSVEVPDAEQEIFEEHTPDQISVISRADQRPEPSAIPEDLRISPAESGRIQTPAMAAAADREDESGDPGHRSESGGEGERGGNSQMAYAAAEVQENVVVVPRGIARDSAVASDRLSALGKRDEIAQNSTRGAEEPTDELTSRRAAATTEEGAQSGVEEFAVNEDFNLFFENNRAILFDSEGNRVQGKVIAEFRVNKFGVPSRIRIISGFSEETNREVINLLVGGPKWKPTDGKRVQTVIEYK